MCGVGFICHIKGHTSHKIVSDARNILCNMTHRGASKSTYAVLPIIADHFSAGADARDGDGAGVMTGIPHDFFVRECTHSFSATLPPQGFYAVGNLFLSVTEFAAQKATFEGLAKDLGLRVLGWRDVPTDNTILGPASKSKEPKIVQPFVVLESYYGEGQESVEGSFDEKYFLRQLYVLRKYATHTMYVLCTSIVSEAHKI
jgi:glutamate synthase (NADPH/NADH)